MSDNVAGGAHFYGPTRAYKMEWKNGKLDTRAQGGFLGAHYRAMCNKPSNGGNVISQ